MKSSKFSTKKKICIAVSIGIAVLLAIFGIGSSLLLYLFPANEETGYSDEVEWSFEEIEWTVENHACMKIAQVEEARCDKSGENAYSECSKPIMAKILPNCTKSATEALNLWANQTLLANATLLPNRTVMANKTILVNETTVANQTWNEALWNCTAPELEECNELRTETIQNCKQLFDGETKYCVNFAGYVKGKENNCSELYSSSIENCYHYNNISKKVDSMMNRDKNYTKMEYELYVNCSDKAQKIGENCAAEINQKTEEDIGIDSCGDLKNRELGECPAPADKSEKDCVTGSHATCLTKLTTEYVSCLQRENYTFEKCESQNCTQINEKAKDKCQQESNTVKDDCEKKYEYEICPDVRKKAMKNCQEQVEKNHSKCIKHVFDMMVHDKYCYYDILNFSNKWCGADLKNYEQNQQFDTSNPSTDDLCLDLVTPLAIQPKCDTMETKESCKQEGGRCYNGRCCPSLKKLGTDQFRVYDFPFKTNVSCHPNSSLPLIFSFAFCHPSDGKVCNVGLYDNAGVLLRSNLRFCANNTDCEEDYVCVNLIQGRRKCYFDPLAERDLDLILAAICFFPLFFVLVALLVCLYFAAYYL